MIVISLCIKQHLSQDSTAANDANNSTGSYTVLPQNEQKVNATALIQRASEYLVFKAGMAIQRYYFPCIILVGLIGNFLSLCVMVKRHNRRISCCVYMAFLAISDNCNLLIGAYYWVHTEMPSPTGRPLYLYECKYLSWIFHSFQQTGVLLIIFMTTDRLIAIKCPLKARVMCTPKRARISGVVIFLFSVIFNTPYIMYSDVNTNGKLCVSFTMQTWFDWAYSWLNMCLNCFFPFIILMTMNCVIIAAMRHRVRSQRKEQRGGTEEENKIKFAKTASVTSQLTVMLLAVTFAFLILTLPQYMRYITYIYKPFKQNPWDYALYVLAAHGSNKMYFTNNAVNFFLYSIGGSKFRRDLKRTLTCCGQKSDMQYIGGVPVGLRTGSQTGSLFWADCYWIMLIVI